MPREVFEFSCPCCGKRVELNARNGKVRAVSIEESRGGKSFEDMVSDQKNEGDRLGSMFDEASEDHASREQTFDGLFSDAKDAVKKDKSKPRHPFRED